MTGVAMERAMSTAWAHLYLARSVNAALVFAATPVGAALAGQRDPFSAPVLAVALSNALLAAASTALNDWHDREADAINRPGRPIPSGRIPARRALALSLAWFAAAVACAAIAGPRYALQALVVVLLSAAYTFTLKGVLVLGNAVAALLWAYPLWCWMIGTAGVRPGSIAIAAGFVLMGVGQEILNTAVDANGDRATGVRTIATTWGVAWANRIGVAMVGVALAFGWLPVLLGIRVPAYTVVLAAASLACAVFAVPQTVLAPGAAASRRIVILGRAIVILMALALTWDRLAR